MKNKVAKQPPPDGGWGILCIFGMAQTMLLFGLAVRSYGVIYLITIEKFQTSATVASGVGATNILVFGAVSIFAAFLCQKFGCRIVTAIGTGCLSAGFILSAHAFHVAVLYIAFGFLCGLGTGFTTTAGFLIVSQYFEKRRALALSLGSAGASLSVFIMPPLTNWLFTYYGYWGCMMILAAISAQGFVSAALFKPLDRFDRPSTPKRSKKHPAENDKIDRDKEKKDSLLEPLNSDKNSKEQEEEMQMIHSGKQAEAEEQQHANSSLLYKLQVFRVPLLNGIIILNVGMTLVATTANTFAPALAVDEGISQALSVLLLSWAGLGDTIGRIVIGFIMDLKRLRAYRLYIYTWCSFIGSLAVFMYPLVTHYGWYTFSMVLYESHIGILFAQRTTVLADVIGMKKMPMMFGFLQTVNALGIMVGRAIGGIIKDAYGYYDIVFYTCGILSFCCILVMVALLIQAARNNTYPKPQTAEHQEGRK